MGGNTVKCSTEHFTVMEHVLSCHETIPYLFANPIKGEQDKLSFPDGGNSFDCANAELDNTAKIIANGLVTSETLVSSIPGNQIDAHDETTVLNDIAVTKDYSVTLKDDGKALYRWGTLIKRPNDIRMYARIPLPDFMKDPAKAKTKVEKAFLVVNHWITNNPNDQLRPEDLENEAATGRKPSYQESISNGETVWKSIKPCYEGDGDLLDTEDGNTDPTFLGVGTVFKNTAFSVQGALGLQGKNPPANMSSDLDQGLTNGFYTTIERDPFEWSYRKSSTSENIHEFVGSAVPNSTLGVLVSGPRWRLKSNKFGQDVPSLEIPKIECNQPPFKKDNIKYEVGAVTATIINLLDWKDANGPLATYQGWVNVSANPFVTVANNVNGLPVSTNGLPMTNDFDLAVYIKGDAKSTAIFSAQLFINQDPPGSISPTVGSISIETLKVPEKIFVGKSQQISVEIENDSASETFTGILTLSNDKGSVFTENFSLKPEKDKKFLFKWTAPTTPGTVNWKAVVRTSNGQSDTATAITEVLKRPGGR